MVLTERQQRVYDFAAKAHSGQLRKYTREPYISHPLAVAGIVHKFCPDLQMGIEISLLHDVAEDTFMSLKDIYNALKSYKYTEYQSSIIYAGVSALTDKFTVDNCPDWNRVKRKSAEAARLRGIAPNFQTIKYADLIHNTESIVDNDPSFAVQYVAEKRQILNVMRMGDLNLFHECYNTLLKAEEKLKYEKTS